MATSGIASSAALQDQFSAAVESKDVGFIKISIRDGIDTTIQVTVLSLIPCCP
jgi:hypothetical protein